MAATFPIYLKYPHERTFFKITSQDSFEQLDIIGNAFHLHQFQAKVYPDKLLILDMIDMKDGYWVESSATEFQEKLAYCQQELTAI